MTSSATPSRHAVARSREKSRYFVHHHIDGRFHQPRAGLNSGALNTTAAESTIEDCEIVGASWNSVLMGGGPRAGVPELLAHELDVVPFLSNPLIVVQENLHGD